MLVQYETNVQTLPPANVINFLVNFSNVIMAVWETLAAMGESVVSMLSVFHYEVGNTPLC